MTLDRTFDYEGRPVAWGREGSGPPVVLCHGTPWSSATWEHVVPTLARDHTVYRWDMLGYGRSMTARGDVSLDAQGRLLAALLAHWHSEGMLVPHVVAHDYGGAVALRALLLHGAQVASLALVDVVALAPWGSDFFLLVREHADVFSRLPAAMHEALVTAYIQGAAAGRLPGATVEQLVAPWLGPVGQVAFYRQIAAADQRWTDEVEPLYPTIEVPGLVVWGEEDPWIPVDRARALAAAIPGARLELVEGVGHLVPLEAPDRLTEVLVSWLGGTARNAGGAAYR